MRACCFQHIAAEGPAYIADWLVAAGHTLTVTRLYDGEPLPDVSDVDLLVVMGGPMSANDEAGVPWLAGEAAFIRDVIAAGVPVLGVCLGAQMVARALGAAVHANPEPEVGWFPVRSAAHLPRGVFTFPAELTVFHWHADTFELPEGAVLLASSDACANQAFQFGERVIALQCHLEVTPVAVASMAYAFREQLQASRYVQTEDEILGAACAGYALGNALMSEVLAYLANGESR